MASESSFDIVSKYDRQEVDNALNQAVKEVSQRYDFKNTAAQLQWSGDAAIMISANSEERVTAALDVLQTKLIKRGVSLKTLDTGDVSPSGKEYRLMISLKEGLDSDAAKTITKLIRDEGPKGVKASIQGDEVRVSSKSRDALQEVMGIVKSADLDVAVQFTNYR